MKPSKCPVIYVAGPFRASTHYALQANIRNAERLALEVWKLGAVAICPHKNTEFFTGEIPDEAFLTGDLELLRRCDAVILTEDWERSSGARAEVVFAREKGIPVFKTLALLREWLRVFDYHIQLAEEPPLKPFVAPPPLKGMIICHATARAVSERLTDEKTASQPSGFVDEVADQKTVVETQGV